MRGYQYLKIFLYSAVDPMRLDQAYADFVQGFRSGRASHAGKYGRQGAGVAGRGNHFAEPGPGGGLSEWSLYGPTTIWVRSHNWTKRP